jgi:hypothetical protein
MAGPLSAVIQARRAARIHSSRLVALGFAQVWNHFGSDGGTMIPLDVPPLDNGLSVGISGVAIGAAGGIALPRVGGGGGGVGSAKPACGGNGGTVLSDGDGGEIAGDWLLRVVVAGRVVGPLKFAGFVGLGGAATVPIWLPMPGGKAVLGSIVFAGAAEVLAGWRVGDAAGALVRTLGGGGSDGSFGSGTGGTRLMGALSVL